jgi:Tol biopolymer transport system component/tRNA A-37 threonylcarbamoyl transferase component Bud32
MSTAGRAGVQHRWREPARRNTFGHARRSATGRMKAADYVIERELGRGGMAAVYLAHDSRHDRRVAIKVLHPELAALLGTERFLREIRVIATLQHPHIVGLIDSGVFGDDGGELAGRPYYVMPYIEGASLRQRLEREGPLPVGDAVRIASEVAGALDYAHRHAVVHRDIKPENILLHDGAALVADFGIALAVQQAGGERLTQTGLSLGTPQYMSPEQALGERIVGARSDIYALGAVTYEMLTGEPPFTGPSSQAIVARLLSETPRPVRATRPGVPSTVETAVSRALERLPADRFETASAFSAALASTVALPESRATALPRRRETLRSPLAWTAVALGAALLGALVMRPRPERTSPPVYRFLVALPLNAGWAGDILSVMALSPDGSRLVYNGRDTSGVRQLYLRRMDRLEAEPVPGSENAAAPFFSEDGRWLGFRVRTAFVRAPADGGSPEPICDRGTLARAVWLGNDAIVLSDTTGLVRCSITGEVSTLLAAEPGAALEFPHVLPDGRGIIFAIARDAGTRLAALDLRSNAVKEFDLAGGDPRYVETGHLVYLGPDRRVRAVGFDARKLEVTGEPFVVDATLPTTYGSAMMALSRNGTIVAARTQIERVLELVDRNGRAERLHTRTGDFEDPSLAPDGRRLAVRFGGDIWVLDRVQGSFSRLTFDSSANRPVWSPDGRSVAYLREAGVRRDVRVVRSDGSGSVQSMRAAPLPPWEVRFTPDGRSLLVRTAGGPGSRDIFLMPLDTAMGVSDLLKSTADEMAPVVSPDGRWMAYVSNESGRAEVHVRAFPSMEGRTQVSLEGGTEPLWSRDGRELFYRSGAAVHAAEVRTAPSFDIVRRTRLFADPDYVGDISHPVYDVTPDGRFVMVRELSGTTHLSVTLNLFQNLPGKR